MRGSLLLLAGLGCGTPPAPAPAVMPEDDTESPTVSQPDESARAEPCPFDVPLRDPERVTPIPLRGVFESPSDGVSLRSTWVPLQLHVAGDRSRGAVEVCLDGWVLPTPLGILRPRNTATGGGTDFIDSLDLSDLEPGEHLLEARLTEPSGSDVEVSSWFTWERPAHRVEIFVTDESGWRVPARVVLTDAEGEFVDLGTPDDAVVDPHDRDVALHSVFARGGKATVYLDPGTWHFTAVRSVLDGLGQAEVDLDGDTVVRLTVPAEISAPEYLSADLHVHSGRSGDSHIPDDARVDSLAAAGLDVVVSTDHRQVVDLQPSFEAVGGALPQLVPGVEAAVRDYQLPANQTDRAHFNVFPLLDESHAALPGEEPETIASLYDDYRLRQQSAPYPGVGDELLIELNHPRGIHFQPDASPKRGAWPLFNAYGYDPALPVDEGDNAWLTEPEPETGTTALGFDAMEIFNRFSLPLYIDVRRDWFALLDQGYRITGTGNSDSHAQQVELAGFPVNLVRSAAEGGSFDLVGFMHAIEQGHVVVTTGPLIELEIEGADGAIARPGDDLTVDGAAVAVVRVRAASWVPVDEVRLVVDGKVVHQQELVGHEGLPLDEVLTWELTLEGDAWVLAEAGWPLEYTSTQPDVGGNYGLVAPGYVPLAFTNPVRIDVDGDGVWSPPGLP